jgi:gliding motility-associated lipoprotein GldH
MRAIIFLACCLLLVACSQDYILNKKYDIVNNNWTYADSLRFEFEIKDTTALHNLVLNVKHTTNFSYQNLYTRIHTQFPDGQRLSKPVSLELADKTGAWQGDCNSKSCTLEIPIQENTYFNQVGNYEIIVEQFMRDSIVGGIQALGLKVTATGERRK